MGLKQRTNHWLQRQLLKPEHLPFSAARTLDEDDIESFKRAAHSREPEAFQHLIAFLEQHVMPHHPTRAKRSIADLKWALKEARRFGLEWQ